MGKCCREKRWKVDSKRLRREREEEEWRASAAGWKIGEEDEGKQ